MPPLSVYRPREIEFRADLVGGYYSIMILGSKLPDEPTVVIIKHRFDERSSFGHSLVQVLILPKPLDTQIHS